MSDHPSATPEPPAPPRTSSPPAYPLSPAHDVPGLVEVVGTGLLGTSIGLALARAGVDVVLSDTVADHVRTASGLGAGRAMTAADRPDLVVVAVPPEPLGRTIAERLRETDAIVTDVGSVKSQPLAEVAALAGNCLGRYVGSHPMAGSERSGPLAATATLFEGRPWAITPHEDAEPSAVAAVRWLVETCGGAAITLSPFEHDRAVARTSHLPHLLSSLVAARLDGAPAEHLALSGQGVRDVTRVAAGSPELYAQIVSANADAVREVLIELREDLDAVLQAVETPNRQLLTAALARGVAGTKAIPGKHGGPARATGSVFVSVPDEPGNLARLFADAGESRINIEDVHIDHDPGRPVGLVELVVGADVADEFLAALESRGWTGHR